MDYNNLGSAGVKVSPLCLGTMMFGGQTSEADSTRIIYKALDLGINFIDTADMYNAGESEVVVGKAIADRRDDFVLATKGRNAMAEGPNHGGGSRLHMTRAVDASLKRLGTDFIDLYYFHAPDYETPIEETLRAMDDMVTSGKVRYLACSNFRSWRLMEALWTADALSLHRFVCLQPLYNIVNRDIEVEVLPACEEYDLGVVSYSPLARGILTGKYKPGESFPEGSRASRNDPRMQQAELREASIEISQQIVKHAEAKGTTASRFSLAWCLANPTLTSIIVGPKTMEQFEDNVQCLDVEITPDDEDFIDSLVPPGEHSGKGHQDSAYPITGRGLSL
jgi:aryl-alcohol dehydrogenase-like predicted oxidoreductase